MPFGIELICTKFSDKRMKNNISRRNFILLGGTLSTGALIDFKDKGFLGDMGENRQLNVGVIGTGSRGTWIIKVIKDIPGINVTACCDVQEANLNRALGFSGKGAKGYSDYRELLDDQEIKAVVIATPLYLHCQLALDALMAGKHIYCEKTMTYDIPEAIHLAKKVNQSKLIFQVGYQQRANPLFHKIHSFISNGYCGTVTHIACHWNRNGDWRRPVADPKLERLVNWRMYREYSGGLMAELCSHQIDVVNWMLGSHPEKVTGFGGVNFWKDGRDTFDNVHAVFEYPEGVKAQFTALTTNAHEGFSMKFYGTKATIEVNREDGQQAFIFPEPNKWNSEQGMDGVTGATQSVYEPGVGIPIKMDQAQNDLFYTGNAFKSFLESVRTNRQPAANVNSGKESAISVHMANLALRNGTIEHWKKEYSG